MAVGSIALVYAPPESLLHLLTFTLPFAGSFREPSSSCSAAPEELQAVSIWRSCATALYRFIYTVAHR
jgi:hypothetical protein